jgi:NADH dehydrogenase FAD-containing subunit
VFEEVEPVGYAGVKVTSLLTGGKGDQCKKIQVGDKLKYTTAIKFISGSSNYKVVVVDCRGLDFDTIVSAIGSNQERFGVDGVELTFSRSMESKQSESM